MDYQLLPSSNSLQWKMTIKIRGNDRLRCRRWSKPFTVPTPSTSTIIALIEDLQGIISPTGKQIFRRAKNGFWRTSFRRRCKICKPVSALSDRKAFSIMPKTMSRDVETVIPGNFPETPGLHTTQIPWPPCLLLAYPS